LENSDLNVLDLANLLLNQNVT